MAYWYLAADDELLIDLDDYMRPTKDGMPWGESFFRRRLRDAMDADKLTVDEVWLTRSNSAKHYQAIVRLGDAMPTVERLVWQLHLGSDLYRGRADLMRAARGIDAPSLLILKAPIPDFYRPADRVCPCTDKHDTEEQARRGDQACAVWRELRGMSPWELFGPSRKGPERAVRLPLGRVPIDWIRRRVVDDGPRRCSRCKRLVCPHHEGPLNCARLPACPDCVGLHYLNGTA